MVGSAGFGQAASVLQARGWGPMTMPHLALAGMAAVQALLILAPSHHPAVIGALWFVFALCGAAGPAGYAAIGQGFTPALAARGHLVEVGGEWSEGRLTGARREADGQLFAGANPRGMQGYAVGR